TILLGLALMGMTYGPLGTILAELFPTAVRYSGSSISFNLAGIFGGALAPILASWLAGRYGLPSVGYYLSAAALVSLAALWLSPEAAADATEAGLKAEAPAALS
ncbi:MAG: MFS transporter, partial [Opitutaceae bacterium]